MSGTDLTILAVLVQHAKSWISSADVPSLEPVMNVDLALASQSKTKDSSQFGPARETG
jgi:hypothetical protein